MGRVRLRKLLLLLLLGLLLPGRQRRLLLCACLHLQPHLNLLLVWLLLVQLNEVHISVCLHPTDPLPLPLPQHRLRWQKLQLRVLCGTRGAGLRLVGLRGTRLK